MSTPAAPTASTVLTTPAVPSQAVPKTKPTVNPVPEPRSVAETGLRKPFLEGLALKSLYLHGPFSLFELSRQLKLCLEVIEQLVERLRAEQLCSVTGMQGNVPNIAITSQGKTRALELLMLNQYAGAAPISMEKYKEMVRLQTVRNVEVHAADVERAFADMVLDTKILWQLGTALNSGSSVFLYGPTGTGKTTVAETLSSVLGQDYVWIPYAVEVEGQIVAVFDPLIHKRAEKAPFGDERWVLCRRPAVMAGGELTLEMLDMQFSPVSKYYTAPLQMKANNGLLIIDDFGRQRVQPEAFLNRWVVPLDRRIDFLTLSGGHTIEVPFEVMVVFSTNKNPSEILEDAFLRRVQTKIKIDAVSDEQFCEIFRRVAANFGLQSDNAMIKELAGTIRTEIKEPLRPCYARDLMNQISWAAKFEGKAPSLDREAIRRAVEAYFLAPA
jgi:predicted ATPase with chaperone activity